MDSKESIIKTILNFNDETFFNIDEDDLDERESDLIDLDFFGIAINAPKAVLTDSEDKLPLVMAARFSGDRDWDIPLSKNCILVGTNLNDGSVYFSKALVDEKALISRGEEEAPGRSPKPPGLALAAAQIMELAPKDRLPIKWETSTWALGLIYYDWPSNSVVVELIGEEDAAMGSAVAVTPDPDPRGGAFLPGFLPTNNTHAPPESGLIFSGEFNIVNEMQQLNIYGAFSVLTRDFHLPEEPFSHQFQDGTQKNVAAVVPITLALLRLDWDEPLQFEWAVPVYGEPLKKGMPAKGFFSIDVLTHRPALAPSVYLCYLVMDGNIFGPKTLKVN